MILMKKEINKPVLQTCDPPEPFSITESVYYDDQFWHTFVNSQESGSKGTDVAYT